MSSTSEKMAEKTSKTIRHTVFPTHNGILSHLSAFVVMVLFVIYSSTSKKSEELDMSASSKLFHTLVHFIHLFSFSTWVGVQFWVHVSGFTLYKTLKRSDFVKVQSKIFPMYFMTGFLTSTVSILTHLYLNPVGSWNNDKISFYQTIGLLTSLVCSVVNLSYFGPEAIRLCSARLERWEYLGIKDAIGPVCLNQVKHDEVYMKIRKEFLTVHMLCSITNLISYGACGICIWCLSSKQLNV